MVPMGDMANTTLAMECKAKYGFRTSQELGRGFVFVATHNISKGEEV